MIKTDRFFEHLKKERIKTDQISEHRRTNRIKTDRFSEHRKKEGIKTDRFTRFSTSSQKQIFTSSSPFELHLVLPQMLS